MTHYLPLVHNRWFEDLDQAMATTMREDEIIPCVINWGNLLASGETIASVAYTDSGLTRSGTALASPETTDNITGIGETEITCTTSTGRKLQKIVRTYSETGHRRLDYA